MSGLGAFEGEVAADHVPLPTKLMMMALSAPEGAREDDPVLQGPLAQVGGATVPVDPDAITDDVTTLVLKDIPYNLTVSDMQDELELLGFTKSVDLIHFAKRKKFMGYAFVNFTSASQARRFAKVFVDYRFEGNTSTKRSNVQVAHIQGLAANVAVLRRGFSRAGNVFIDPASAEALGLHTACADRETKPMPNHSTGLRIGCESSFQNYESYQSYQNHQTYHNHQGYQSHQSYQNHQGYQGNQGYQNHQGYQNNQGYQNHQDYQNHQGYQNNQGYQNHQDYQNHQGYQNNQGCQNHPDYQNHNSHQSYQNYENFQTPPWNDPIQ